MLSEIVGRKPVRTRRLVRTPQHARPEDRRLINPALRDGFFLYFKLSDVAWQNVHNNVQKVMGESAKCVWDDVKEASNIATHAYAFGLDQVFDGRRIVTTVDKRQDYGEPRFNALVEYDKRIINITFTPRHGKVRLISVRAASREEREAYYGANPHD